MRVLLLLALLVVFWLERMLYREHALEQVSVRLRFDPVRTVQDGLSELVLEVSHTGLLPVPWVAIQVALPVELQAAAKHLGVVDAVVRVPYRATVERRYPVTPGLRGLYHIGELQVTVGDLFGTVQRTERVGVQARLLVRPKARDLRAPVREAVRVGLLERRSLFEDPTSYRGIREYLPSDPLRRIHWPKSAQLDRMVVREYATAAEFRLCLIANLAIVEPHWRATDRDRVEAVVSATAGVAQEAARLAVPFELWVNAPAFEPTALSHLPAGSGPRHLDSLLDFLARLATSAAESPLPLIARARTLSEAQGLIFITSALDARWAHALGQAAERESVTVLLLTEGTTSLPPLRRSVHLVRIPLTARADPEDHAAAPSPASAGAVAAKGGALP